MDYQKLFESDISMDAVKAWKAKGKKAVGVICCHVPEEIFYAADVLPVRMRSTNITETSEAQMWMSSFSCSFARGMLQGWLEGPYKELDGIVTSDGCMQASRVHDNARYINIRNNTGKFIRQVDAPRKLNDHAFPFYEAELKDLIHDLEELSGVKITDERLKAAVEKSNEVRRLVAELF